MKYYNTRKNSYVIPHRTTFFEKGSIHTGLKIIEKLPNNIKNEKDYRKFKKVLKEYIINKEPYSVDEFL